ncbi:MAG: lysophospholipid acyltransferase family protein [Chloroflexota bacterium]
MTQQLDLLTRINLDDLVSSFGWQDSPLLAHLLRRIFHSPAQTFAEAMVEFDDAVGASSLPDASRLLLGRYVREVRVYGRENIPSTSFLALSNHPGMADTVALFAALNRTDLKIIALDRPFLKALPHTSKQLFYLKDDPAARMTLVRQVSAHLKSGGSALTFPAGEIEPDPNVYPGALEALTKWTDSAGVFLRMAPETVILPTLVRGVIWEKMARHPIVRLKRDRMGREKLAAAFQLLAHVQFKQRPVTVTVQIGQPITVEKLGSKETQVIHQAVLAEMRRLIQNPPEGEGERVIGVSSKPISYPISNY